MEIPIVAESPDEISIVRTVKVGDVIRSPMFRNLIFRDIRDLDAFLGMFVNPYKYKKHWDNTRNEVLESPGRIVDKTKSAGSIERTKNLKLSIDAMRHFVVIFTFRNTEYEKEYFDEDDRAGHYPLGVVAKMLSPDGEYDKDGLEIWFNMDSRNAKHAIEEVELTGFFHVTYKNIF